MKIKNKLIDNEIYEKVKDYSKEKNRVRTYFEVGKLLSDAGSYYGKDVVGDYSKKLADEVNRKYNRRTLFRMKQVYNTFNNEKVSALLTQLSWSHCLELVVLKDINQIIYYAKVTIQNRINYRQLHEKIKSKEYERLDDKTRYKLINQEQTTVSDFIKNPILIKNIYNHKEISEKILKQLRLEDMDNFLTELGEGFCYIKNEYKIKLGDRYNYIDLLLYNIKYKCYVVVELKVTELRCEYMGQIQKYMNYINKNVKSKYEDETIGIIICRKDNKFVMEYCSDDRIFRTIYLLN